MKRYVSVVRQAGGKTKVTVTLVDGTLSAKAEWVTYVDKVAEATREADAMARRLMEKIKDGSEGVA